MDTRVDSSGTAFSSPSLGKLKSLRLGRLPQRLVLSWVISAGIVAGGFFVVALQVLERLSVSALMPAVLLLFLLGSMGGFVHGALLAYVGRPPDFTREDWRRSVGASALWMVPALGVAGVIAMWIGLTNAALKSASVPMLIPVVISWQLGIAACIWAGVEGWVATRNAFERWPHSRVGTLLILTTFTALVVLFLARQPEIWWTDMRVTDVGAVILALGATIWVALPVVVAGLHLLHRGMRGGVESAPPVA